MKVLLAASARTDIKKEGEAWGPRAHRGLQLSDDFHRPVLLSASSAVLGCARRGLSSNGRRAEAE